MSPSTTSRDAVQIAPRAIDGRTSTRTVSPRPTKARSTAEPTKPVRR